MSEYQLELKQIVDYPRCRIYRQFIKMLMQDENIRTGGSSGLYYFTVLCSYANFRTSYKRVDGISYTIYPGEWICRVSELTEWFRTRFQHQAISILKDLQDRHLITYSLLGRGNLIKFKIKGWCKHNRVLDYNAPCQKDTGFFFLPVSAANELVGSGRCSEIDAMLDLWVNTIYNDTQVQGSELGPVVYMHNGTGNRPFDTVKYRVASKDGAYCKECSPIYSVVKGLALISMFLDPKVTSTVWVPALHALTFSRV